MVKIRTLVLVVVVAVGLSIGITTAATRYFVGDEADQRIAAINASRLRFCEESNKRDAHRLQALSTLTPNPRYQEVLADAFGPVDCKKLVG